MQGCGLTETIASASCTDINELSVDRIGAPFSGIKIKLIDWPEGGYRPTDKPYPRGEIVIGGNNVAVGYYKNQQLTKEFFKNENGIRWFHTGDIAQVYPNGSFKIIDRKKDIIKLQFGEDIALGKTESKLIGCPFVDNIYIYGNSFHNYLIALIAPNAKALKSLALQLGKENLSHEELCNDTEITNEVNKAICEYGIEVRLSRKEIPTKIKLCTEEWIPDNGLVTPSLKLKRKSVEEFYINDMKLYEEEWNWMHS